MSIKPDYFTLDTLLQKRLFRIPNYQRAYSWETKQRKALFDDIQKLKELKSHSNNRHHFMATVVCLNTNKEEHKGSEPSLCHHRRPRSRKDNYPGGIGGTGISVCA
jgi:hypothetical protein